MRIPCNIAAKLFDYPRVVFVFYPFLYSGNISVVNSNIKGTREENFKLHNLSSHGGNKLHKVYVCSTGFVKTVLSKWCFSCQKFLFFFIISFFFFYALLSFNKSSLTMIFFMLIISLQCRIHRKRCWFVACKIISEIGNWIGFSLNIFTFPRLKRLFPLY